MSVLLRVIGNIRRDESAQSAWMLPYSTLMLILMIFFAALYGFSYLQSVQYETALADLEVTGPRAEESAARREVLLAQSIEKYIRDAGMTALAEVKISAQFIRLELSSPALFDSGSADLRPGITPLFRELAGQLASMDNVIIVEGHTDNVPIHTELYASNWELSAARAFSVIYYFIKEGITPERLVAHGFGEFRPAYSNDTEEERAKNRRIEFKIVRKGGQR